MVELASLIARRTSSSRSLSAAARRRPLPRRSDQRRDHRLHRGAGKGARDQTGDQQPRRRGSARRDLRLSFDAEYAKNDIFPPTDITEDWLHLIDYDSENVVKVAPVRPGEMRAATRGGAII